jgi:hypothetical protein
VRSPLAPALGQTLVERPRRKRTYRSATEAARAGDAPAMRRFQSVRQVSDALRDDALVQSGDALRDAGKRVGRGSLA